MKFYLVWALAFTIACTVAITSFLIGNIFLLEGGMLVGNILRSIGGSAIVLAACLLLGGYFRWVSILNAE